MFFFFLIEMQKFNPKKKKQFTIYKLLQKHIF